MKTRTRRSVFRARREAVILAMHPFSKTMRALQMSSPPSMTVTPTASTRLILLDARDRMMSMS